MPAVAWCILKVQTLTTLDHAIGAIGSALFMGVMYATHQIYQESREKLLVLMLLAPFPPILAYGYRLFT